MAIRVKKMRVWVAPLKNRPGGLAEKLAPLSEAGADLQFALARRQTKTKGVVFVSGLKGAKQLRAARENGFEQSESLHALRVEGGNAGGLGARISEALAGAGINMRGLSAGVVGSKFVMHVAFDSAQDAGKASRILRKM